MRCRIWPFEIFKMAAAAILECIVLEIAPLDPSLSGLKPLHTYVKRAVC